MRQNSNQTKHLPTLLVQQIRLQWYKDCRGGNAAAQRNQYPRAMRLPKDFFSYYPFGLPTHFASIIQRPDGFQIDRDCRRLMEWKPNGTMRLHPFELIQQESGIQVHYRYCLLYTSSQLLSGDPPLSGGDPIQVGARLGRPAGCLLYTSAPWPKLHKVSGICF